MTQQNTHLIHPKYRSDIDGLRAIAVLSVVVFHAFPNWMKGGFIGVDVFFVISGFLISTIIFKNLDEGAFSFSEFYARRIKRIYPALLVVLIVCYSFGWFVLLADEYKQLGKHMVGGAIFISNFVLWSEAGYFDNSAESKPLLHLWSLGVEEQFYIFWPLLLWVAWRLKFNALKIILVVAVVSFLLNMSGIKHDPIATFYSPQTRFWELLCGSILAWLALYKKEYFQSNNFILNYWLASFKKALGVSEGSINLPDIISLVGILLLCFGFLKIDKNIGFPGVWAIVPVLGAVLLIAAGGGAWINRTILSNRIAVGFGLISFPLYLWHWPLLSFARIMNGGVPERSTLNIIIVISIFLAWITYVMIEKRVRVTLKFKHMTFMLFTLMCVVGFVGYGTYVRDGIGSRLNNGDVYDDQLLTKLAVAWVNRSYPIPGNFSIDKKYGYNSVGNSEDNKILFVGDSHTYQYWNSVSSLYEKGIANKSVVSTLFESSGSNFPPNLDERIFDDHSIKKIVFSYYWSYRYGSNTVNQSLRCCGNGKGGSIGVNTIPFATDAQMDSYDRQLVSLIKKLKNFGKEVWVVLDNPFGEELDPHFMFQRSWRGVTLTSQSQLATRDAALRLEPVKGRLMKLSKLSGARVIDPMTSLCSSEYCSTYTEEGEFMYKDYDHLSLFASQHSVRFLDILYSSK